MSQLYLEDEKTTLPILKFNSSEKWQLNIKIGDLTEKVIAGATPRTSNNEYWENGTIPWLSSGEIHKKNIEFTDKFITELGFHNSSTKMIPKHSVLIALAGQGKTRGTVAINNIELCTNQSVASMIPNVEKIYYKFLFYYLENQYDRLRSLSSSDGGRGGLNLKLIKSFKINLPSIDEQKKIANFLSAIDKKIELLEMKCEKYDEIKKYFLNEIFVIKNYAYKTSLGELCTIQTGKLDANAMVENGAYRFYTCAKEYYQIDKYEFDTEALLISGNGAHVGYIHYYNGKFNAYQRTYVLNDFNEDIDIKYVKYFLEKHLHKQIWKEKKEGNTPYIVLSTLKDMEIIYPNLKEQQLIKNLFENIDKKVDLCYKQTNYLKEFKKGLLQKMFV